MCRIVECLQNFVFKVFFEYYSIKDFGFATNLYVYTLHAVDAVLIKQHVMAFIMDLSCYSVPQLPFTHHCTRHPCPADKSLFQVYIV